ncbi:hypothetical protein LSTR_LSTR003615 [Laodelphax striatellus]|uniref:Uncharacterized protein n=1 Tax=Laodelphax striatellus TaxID=195883 RepID=A0A482WKZ0_LAOST|nr:hypothetical protein LSTR_LSTR003615 [Laodelphax striatellus]
MDVSLRLLRYAKKDATTEDEKSVDNLPHLCLKLVATTMLIMNQNTIVDTFALKGKKTKSAFSNNTLVVQRIETRNRYDLWRFQVHNDVRPDEIENFLKRIKTVTTFLTVEDSQDLPMETDSTMYDSAPFINNIESFSRENEFKIPEAASLKWNMKLPIQHQWDSTDSDSTVGNSISLLRSLKIEEGPQFRQNHTVVHPPIKEIQYKTNQGSVYPQNQEGLFKTNRNVGSHPVGESGSFDSFNKQMLSSIVEDRPFDASSMNIPSRVANTGPFEMNSNILPYSIGRKIQLNPNNEIMTTRFEEKRLFNTAHGSMQPQAEESQQFNKVHREIQIPTQGRRPFNATNRDFPSPIPNKRPFETNRAVSRHSIVGKMDLTTKNETLPNQFGDRKLLPHSVGGIIPLNNETMQSSSISAEAKISKPNHSLMSCPVGIQKPCKLHNVATEARQFLATNNIFPQPISGRLFINKNMQRSVEEEGRSTNEEIIKPIAERQIMLRRYEILPYPTGRKLPNSTNNFMPSKIVGQREQFNTTGMGLPPPPNSTNKFMSSTLIQEETRFNTTNVNLPQSIDSGPLEATHLNVASSITTEKPLPANEVGPNESLDERTHMNVDTDEKNDVLTLENDLITQSSQFIQTFSLKSVDAQACIAEPLRLGPLLVRKVMDQLPESSITVLTDPNYDGHFKAVEEALEAGTNCYGNSQREIMKAFVRSDAFLPFIEGMKSLLNNEE